MSTARTRARDAIPPRERRECSRCGAYCRNEDAECWFCRRSFSQPDPPPLKSGQFSLATLLGAMTAVAVGLGLYVFSQPLAIGAGVLCGAAAVRMVVVREMQREMQPRRFRAPLWLSFVVSLAIVFWTAASFVVVFSLGCLVSVSLMSDGGGPPMPDFPLWPIGLGFFWAVTFACFLLWATRDLPD